MEQGAASPKKNTGVVRNSSLPAEKLQSSLKSVTHGRNL